MGIHVEVNSSPHQNHLSTQIVVRTDDLIVEVNKKSDLSRSDVKSDIERKRNPFNRSQIAKQSLIGQRREDFDDVGTENRSEHASDNESDI